MVDRVPMTPEGHRKLQEELKHLKAVERPKVIQAIEDARGHGDLSENAEYDAAKEHQQQLDQRIREVEDKLARAQIIDPEALDSNKVVFGATVVLTDVDNDRRVTYQLVGADEADRAKGRISVGSPLARAMIGKEAGDAILVNTPAGEREYVVEEVKFG